MLMSKKIAVELLELNNKIHTCPVKLKVTLSYIDRGKSLVNYSFLSQIISVTLFFHNDSLR